jgi:hypothetical protein
MPCRQRLGRSIRSEEHEKESIVKRFQVLAILLLVDAAVFATPFGREHWDDAALSFAAFFAGALLFISLALIPSWQTLAPKAYLESFGAFLPFAAPLTPLLGASAFAFILAVLARNSSHVLVPAMGVAIGGLLCVFALSLAVNLPINMRVLRGRDSISTEDIVNLRNRWAMGHRVRTVAGVVAFFALLAGLGR